MLYIYSLLIETNSNYTRRYSIGIMYVDIYMIILMSWKWLVRKTKSYIVKNVHISTVNLLQVIHDAIESVSTFEPHAPDGPSSIGRALTPCTCKDGEETNNNNNDCLCGLDSYVVSSATRRSRNNTHFDNWVIRNCSTSSK